MTFDFGKYPDIGVRKAIRTVLVELGFGGDSVRSNRIRSAESPGQYLVGLCGGILSVIALERSFFSG